MAMSGAERQAQYKATAKGRLINAKLQAQRRARLETQDTNPLTGKKYTISTKSQARDLQRLVEVRAGTEDAMRKRNIRLKNAGQRLETTGTTKPVKPNLLRGGHGTRATSEGGHFPRPQSKEGATKEGNYVRQSRESNRSQGGRMPRDWWNSEAKKGRVPHPARPSEMIAKPANAKIMSTNPAGAGAKSSTLSGRSWMWNIGTKLK